MTRRASISEKEGIGGLAGSMQRLDPAQGTLTALAEGFDMPEIGFVNIGLDAASVYFASGPQLLRVDK